MTSAKQSRSRAAADQQNLCQFSFADGRQCRMFRADSHPSLCVFHAREELQLLEADEVGDELASISGEFRTHTDINHVIGRLFKLVAAGRIPVRRAQNLSYLAQLLLQSQKDIRWETNIAHDLDHRAWDATVRAAYPEAEAEPKDETESEEQAQREPDRQAVPAN